MTGLKFQVKEDDKLPKNICLKCCTKLHSVCEFIDTARKAQDILLSRSRLLEQIIDEKPVEKHTYIKIEPSSYFDDDSHVMEVSVDPMMVLQNSESLDTATGSDAEDNHTFDTEEYSYLHGLENENVTIKLIRRQENNVENVDLSHLDVKKKNEEHLKPFGCISCARSFLTELALKNHSWIHYNDDKTIKHFKCVTCKASFEYKADLIVHLKEHKSNVTCKICGRVFRSEENLALHLETHTSTSHAYVCKVCGRAYNTSSNLKTHSITHSNERPYECHLCKKKFKRNQDLKFHINQHTGARPYKCPFCDKSFASSGNCYSHRSRMHPGKTEELKNTLPLKRRGPPKVKEYKTVPIKGAPEYKCHLCSHRFVKRDNFTYHMYKHTGQKPFQCTFCEEKFVTRKGLLLHHDKTHSLLERPLALLSKNSLLK